MSLIRTNYSLRSVLGQDLRGDKLRKKDFRKILVWVGKAQTQNNGVVMQYQLWNSQRGVTCAVNAGIAAIVILVFRWRSAGARMGCRKLPMGDD